VLMKPDMSAQDVVKLYDLLEANGIHVCIDGGWGVDALLGRQTRAHGDLDIAMQHKDVPKLRELLAAKGYSEVSRPDTRDCNFVLGDDRGREVDVHSYTFDSAGRHTFGIPYPAESLTGTGTIDGRTVKCISLQGVMEFRANYEPDDGDVRDVQALVKAFDVKSPANYENRL
jgi:lincosamide nucleotidyltransferase A/C/D/E